MADPRQPRWPRLTLDRLLIGLFALECLLWLSERFQWFFFNHHRGSDILLSVAGVRLAITGWAVLLCVASVGVAIFVMLVWFIVAFIFGRRFQFGIRSLLILMLVVAVACSWLSWDMRDVERQRRATCYDNIATMCMVFRSDPRVWSGDPGRSNLAKWQRTAVDDATRACELSDWSNWSHLCTLAEAYAQNGDFKKARESAAKALHLAWDEEDKQECRSHLELYEQGKPYRSPINGTPSPKQPATGSTFASGETK